MNSQEDKAINGSLNVLNSFQLTENMAGLDSASKNVLHNAEVLANILKNVVPEYSDYTKEEVMEFIDMDSCSDETEVSPGRTNTEISEEITEYQILNEKTSNFDLAFSAKNPKLSNAKIVIRLHIDMEPQKTYHPGYPIEKRGYYYLSRRFSSQLSLVFNDTDYNSLEKCYSIWICRDDVPKDELYSASFYEITNTRNIGNCHPKREDYDLMTLVLIRLGDKVYNGCKDDEGHDLFDFLNLIMYPHDKDFINNVSKYIDFSNNTKLRREAGNMSGLGECVLNDGIKIGKAEGIIEGKAEGKIETTERLNKLNAILLDSGRYDDLKRTTKDKDFQEKLLDELVPIVANGCCNII
jgi:hypothetical protein